MDEMNKAGEMAVDTFKQNFNCAQAVFSTFAERFGLDRTTALRIAAVFGGGVARRGEMCGAASGALMALGLARARATPEGREENYALAQEFMRRFEQEHGSLLCRDLIKFDLSTPAGRQQAHDSGITSTLCPALVRFAAAQIEEMLQMPCG